MIKFFIYLFTDLFIYLFYLFYLFIYLFIFVSDWLYICLDCFFFVCRWSVCACVCARVCFVFLIIVFCRQTTLYCVLIVFVGRWTRGKSFEGNRNQLRRCWCRIIKAETKEGIYIIIIYYYHYYHWYYYYILLLLL